MSQAEWQTPLEHAIALFEGGDLDRAFAELERAMGRSNSFATRVILVEGQEFGSATAKENPSKEFRIMGHTGQLLVRKL